MLLRTPTQDGEDLDLAAGRFLAVLHDVVFHYGDGTDGSLLDGWDARYAAVQLQRLAATVADAAKAAATAAALYQWRHDHHWIRGCDGVLVDPDRRIDALQLAAAAAKASVELHDIVRREHEEGTEYYDDLGSSAATAACAQPGVTFEFEPNGLGDAATPATFPNPGDDVVLVNARCVGCNLEIVTDNTGRLW